jgi:hypothetical protein
MIEAEAVVKSHLLYGGVGEVILEKVQAEVRWW